MENEMDTTPSTKSGRLSRRNKLQPQTERDKDQENIDSSPIDGELSRGAVVKVENKQSTPSASIVAENNVNSSTPRRKKDPLANLHSNLSPKYIGFVTPNSNSDNSIEERPRATRRRHFKRENNASNANVDATVSRDSSLDMSDIQTGQLFGGSLDATSTLGYVRRTPTGGKDSNSNTPERKNVKRREFVSPIDKLLKKNGSIVDSVLILPLEDKKQMEVLNNIVLVKTAIENSVDTTKYMEPNNNENEINIEKVQIDQLNSQREEITIESEAERSMRREAEQEGNGYLPPFEATTVEESMQGDNGIGLEATGDHTEGVDKAESEKSFTECSEFYQNSSGFDFSQTVIDKRINVDGKDKNLVVKSIEKESKLFNNSCIDHYQQYSNLKAKAAQAKYEEVIENCNTMQAIGAAPEELFTNTDPSSIGLMGTLEKQNSTECEPESNITSQSVRKSEHHHHDINIKTELDDMESNAEFAVVNTSAKSPSAISMDSAKGSSILNEGTWMSYSVGDLFWGQIYSYCYWPCMVCPDPEGKTISTKETVSDQHVMVHVRFFADNGRRNWVKQENLMPYTTLQNYQDRLNECREKYGPKSTKYKLLVPKRAKVPIWHGAVAEMEIVAKVPHEKRLETFFEIFEKSKAFQKKEKERRKSLYLPIGRHISNSDAESFYGSNENVNNLSAPSANIKRDRSVSPFSPAFSPIKSTTLKRRKLSEDNVEMEMLQRSNHQPPASNDAELRRQSQSSGISSTLTGLDIFQGIEFESFYGVMREFVLDKNENEILEKSLFIAVRNIWALKQVSREQMEHKLRSISTKVDEKDNVPNDVTNGGDVKRLSNRLKNLLARKSFTQSQQLPSPYVDLSREDPAITGVAKATKDEAMSAKKDSRFKIVNRPILEVIDDIFELDNRYLFKGMSRDPVCKYCYKPGGNLKRCVKNCNSWLHSDCPHIDFKLNNKGKRAHKQVNGLKSINDITTEPGSKAPSLSELADTMQRPTSAVLHVTSDTLILDEDVICKECANNDPTKCMVCHLTESSKSEDPLVKCSMAQCDRAFHPACCKYWPQSKITISKNHIQAFRCPSHVCHTCVSDDPKGKFQHISSNKITKCVKCPATYHTDSTCIPAGSQILTTAHIICPRHTSTQQDMTVNVNWCFICVGGGQVVCCETCPTAVHAQCLKIPIDPNEGYICEECESGRMPLYGEMVWAKFNIFRWWPAIILPPTEIPINIAKKPHNPSDFVVRFFGTHDHAWISRRRVYLYLEGDSSEPPKAKSHRDMHYMRGVKEAKEVYEIVKAKKIEQQNANEGKERLHPQPYVRIRANRAVPPVKLHVDMESVGKCECDPNDINPCGPESSCLNRVLYHECNPKVCPAGERCQNQMFESRISPRMDVVYMKERGFGLVSREPIAAGTFIIEYVGEIINDDEFRARMSQMSLDRDENFYFLSVEKDYIIDAGPKGNLARFMNHSCDPNCETQKWSVNSLNRVGLFAIKDIPVNTELTFNYHWDDLLGNEKKTCYCGSKKCAGQIGGKIKEDTKESSPFSDITVNKTKGKTKTKAKTKTKLKPLKRLHPNANVKHKTTSKPKRSAVKHKSNKMMAAAALAAALSESISPHLCSKSDRDDVAGSDIDASPTTSRSQSPEDVVC